MANGMETANSVLKQKLKSAIQKVWPGARVNRGRINPRATPHNRATTCFRRIPKGIPGAVPSLMLSKIPVSRLPSRGNGGTGIARRIVPDLQCPLAVE